MAERLDEIDKGGSGRPKPSGRLLSAAFGSRIGALALALIMAVVLCLVLGRPYFGREWKLPLSISAEIRFLGRKFQRCVRKL